MDNFNEKYSTPSRVVLLVGFIATMGLLLSFIFDIGLEQLVFIPNSLVIATYVIGTAAGVKLITNVLGKVLAVIACILCLAAYPFIGSFIAILIIVALSFIVYITWRAKREKYGTLEAYFL